MDYKQYQVGMVQGKIFELKAIDGTYRRSLDCVGKFDKIFKEIIKVVEKWKQ